MTIRQQLVFGVLLVATTAWAVADEPGTADANSSDPVRMTIRDEPRQETSYTTTEVTASLEAAADAPYGCGHPAGCSCAKMQALKKAVAASHKGVFYDNKFDYLCDPCYDGWALGDQLKRLAVGDLITVDVGGQYRLREQSEREMRNMLYSPPGGTARPTGGLTGHSDDFLLQRTRLYVNTEIGERVRVYVETLDAQSAHQKFAPRANEVNRWELQNLFGDFVMLEDCGGKLTARLGRQELLYGSQRIISPLDWANTRRTFDAGKLMWKGTDWDIDAFWARPLRREFERLDPSNENRELYGIYSTYKGWGKDTLDLYWLLEDWHEYPATPPGFDYQTAGGRYNGSSGQWLYEAEGGYQFGKNSDRTDHTAGFFTLGLGRKLECLTWKPTLWGYYDWASGANQAGNGYSQYEPLGHKYLGYMDFFGRANIEDANVQLTMQPTERLTLLAWFHYFWLQNGHDVPYNVDMVPYANLGTNSAGSRDLGEELDLTATVTLTQRMSAMFGYSHFFSGQFYKTTPSIPYRGDADFFYTQFTVDF
ncbi:MAG: alginate export family protein [Planctomycetota bacterium]|nr:alginate export family protein [Planctomycetota bacterium]